MPEPNARFEIANERLEKIIDTFGHTALSEPFRAIVYLDSFIPESVNKKPFYAAIAHGLSRELDNMKEHHGSQRESLQTLMEYYRRQSGEYFSTAKGGAVRHEAPAH